MSGFVEPMSRVPPPNPAGKAVTKVVWRCNDAQETQKLDLSECQLMSFPDAIYHLMRNTTLLTCDLSSNVLRKIPPKFAIKFNFITELNLSRNHLSTLPEELKEATQLQKLDISHNAFFSLPRVVFKMAAIVHIDAHKNSICEVDVTRLKSLTTLQDFNLEDNPLTETCHRQLKSIPKLKLKLSDPVVDTDSDFEDMDTPTGSPK